MERITVTLPPELVKGIDRVEKNRSKFIADAVRQELERRRRAELLRSLQNPHAETAELEQAGFDEWTKNLPDEGLDFLVKRGAGTPVRWIGGKGG